MESILKKVREEKGQYGYPDVVNACGLSYARLYSEIEQRHENGQELALQNHMFGSSRMYEMLSMFDFGYGI